MTDSSLSLSLFLSLGQPNKRANQIQRGHEPEDAVGVDGAPVASVHVAHRARKGQRLCRLQVTGPRDIQIILFLSKQEKE